MKKVFIVLIFSLSVLNIWGQKPNPEFNSELAKKYGGDENGMKNYYMVILRTGPNNIQDKSLRDSLFAGHMNNIKRLANDGKLVVAGPFGSNGKGYRGIFILDAKSEDEARELVMTDPVVKAKVLDAEIIEWYGSAALPSYLDVHGKITKNKD